MVKSMRSTIVFCVLLVAMAVPAFAASRTEGRDGLITEVEIKSLPTDTLVVNATIHGADFLFVLDTGSTHSTFATEMHKWCLNDVPANHQRQLWSDEARLKLYTVIPGLAIKVGDLEWNCAGPVHCEDFREINRSAGYVHGGILGMDFLHNYVVQIDFDLRVVRFYKSMRDIPGTRLPLTIKQSCPYVLATYGDDLPAQFLVDTGATIGCMKKDVFLELSADKAAAEVGSGFIPQIGGPRRATTIVQLSTFSVGGFEHRDTRWNTATYNSLGANSLCRYVVTFDFPGRAIYLKKGRRFEATPNWDSAGLDLFVLRGKVTVRIVDRGSPADLAGIVAGDYVVRIKDVPAAQTSVSKMRRAVAASAGGKMSITVERDGAEIECVMKIPPNVSGDANVEKGRQSLSLPLNAN